MEKIKIIIADDHQIVLDGLHLVFKEAPHIEVVSQAQNGEEVLAYLREHKHNVDVAVLDIEMDQLNGIETTKKIREFYPHIKVLILTMYKTNGFITQMVHAGVSGYVLKERGHAELVKAVETVHSGEEYYDRDVAKILIDGIKNDGPVPIKLTRREIDVLKLIGEGMTTPQIAEKLFISENTVNTHRKHLLEKLGAKNKSDLIKYAIENGFVK